MHKWTIERDAYGVERYYTNAPKSGKVAPRYWYVNVYSLFRNHGGPEEGGWWYDEGEPVAGISIRVPITYLEETECDWAPGRPDKWVPTGRFQWFPKTAYEDAHKIASALQSIYGGQERYSVVPRDQDFGVYVEDHPARHWPKVRPHYE